MGRTRGGGYESDGPPLTQMPKAPTGPAPGAKPVHGTGTGVCDVRMIHHLVDSPEMREAGRRQGFDLGGHPPNCPVWRDPYLDTTPVHTCGPGCRVEVRGQTVDHFGWPADYRGSLPQLGCGLVCVPEMTCGGCPPGTPANPVTPGQQRPVEFVQVERSAAPREHTAPRVRMRTGSLGIEFREPLTEPLLLVPESHWDDDDGPIVAASTWGTSTPRTDRACTCGARPGQGHQLRCAVYA